LSEKRLSRGTVCIALEDIFLNNRILCVVEVTPCWQCRCSLCVFHWFYFCCNLPVCIYCRQQRPTTSDKTFLRCLTSRLRTQKQGRCVMRIRTRGGSRRDLSAL